MTDTVMLSSRYFQLMFSGASEALTALAEAKQEETKGEVDLNGIPLVTQCNDVKDAGNKFFEGKLAPIGEVLRECPQLLIVRKVAGDLEAILPGGAVYARLQELQETLASSSELSELFVQATDEFSEACTALIKAEKEVLEPEQGKIVERDEAIRVFYASVKACAEKATKVAAEEQDPGYIAGLLQRRATPVTQPPAEQKEGATERRRLPEELQRGIKSSRSPAESMAPPPVPPLTGQNQEQNIRDAMHLSGEGEPANPAAPTKPWGNQGAWLGAIACGSIAALARVAILGALSFPVTTLSTAILVVVCAGLGGFIGSTFLDRSCCHRPGTGPASPEGDDYNRGEGRI